MKKINLRMRLLCIAGLLMITTGSYAENIVFPPGAGVINVKTAYGAYGDGIHDDTQALQAAITDARGDWQIVYLPNGTYLISETLNWGDNAQFLQMRGQSKAGVVIRLMDTLTAFSDPENRKAAIFTGLAPAQRIGNYIRNLTIHTGTGNPGACGVQFHANNWGGIMNVDIVSGDGTGVYGVDMEYTNEIGPLMIKHVYINGFDVGIRSSTSINSQTLEYVTLENQNIAAIHNTKDMLFMRKITSINSVPAILNDNAIGHVICLDGTFSGGSSATNAIINSGYFYGVRLNSTGYNNLGISPSASGEYLSHGVSSLFESEGRSLQLDIEDTPEVPWDENVNEWVNIADFGAVRGETADNNAAIQAAIDYADGIGAKTVYFPNSSNRDGKWNWNGAVTIHGSINRVIGCMSLLGSGDNKFIIEEGTAPVIVLEGFHGVDGVELRTSKTVVIRNGVFKNIVTTSGTGKLFLEDVTGDVREFRNGQQVFARQLNPEGHEGVDILNDGSELWILGMKTEGYGIKTLTKNGGKSEILGVHNYSVNGTISEDIYFSTEDASFSVACYRETNFNGTPYNIYVRETRNGETRELTRSQNGTHIGLFSGFEEPIVPCTEELPLEMESFDERSPSGIYIKTYPEGQYVEFSKDKYIRFNQVDLGDGTYHTMVAKVSANADNRSFEIRADNINGPLLGLLNITSTGSWNLFTEQTATFSSLQGAHDLFIIGRGGFPACKIDYIKLIKDCTPPNIAPLVNLTAPDSGALFFTNDTVVLYSEASDTDGTVSMVRFYVNGQLSGTVSETPYTISITGLSPGEYDLMAVAVYDDNDSTASSTVQITIEEVVCIPLLIEAESFTNSSDNVNIYNFSGGQFVQLGKDRWAQYSSIDFGYGLQSLDVHVATGSDNRSMEFRIDALDGQLIANLNVSNTGSWDNFELQSVNLPEQVTGQHDLFIIGRGGWPAVKFDYVSVLCSLKSGRLNNSNNSIEIPTLRIYPNPAKANSELRIDFNTDNNHDIQIRIYDLSGAIIAQKVVMCQTKNSVIDLNGIKSGMYYLELNTSSEVITKQLMIE